MGNIITEGPLFDEVLFVDSGRMFVVCSVPPAAAEDGDRSPRPHQIRVTLCHQRNFILEVIVGRGVR